MMQTQELGSGRGAASRGRSDSVAIFARAPDHLRNLCHLRPWRTCLPLRPWSLLANLRLELRAWRLGVCFW
jgi:hypothetical protein